MCAVLVKRVSRIGRQSDVRMRREVIAGGGVIRNHHCKGGIESGWRQMAFSLVRQRAEHVIRHLECGWFTRHDRHPINPNSH